MMKHMRTAAIACALAGTLALGAAASTAAQKITADFRPDMTVQVDGEKRTMLDQNGNLVYPISYNGTTYLPVRALGEILGQKVEWDSKTQTVLLTEKVVEPGKPYTTIGAVEKAMTASEMAVADLRPAATYPERAKQYAARAAELDAIRSSLDAIVKQDQEDFRSGKTDYKTYNSAQERTDAVDARLKDTYAALERKTIADDTGKRTPYQESDVAIQDLESRLAALNTEIQNLKVAGDYASRIKQYLALDDKLSALSADVNARMGIVNEDLRQGRLSYREYNVLSRRAGSVDVALKDARAGLEDKIFQSDDGKEDPMPDIGDKNLYDQYAAKISGLDGKADKLWKDVENYRPAHSDHSNKQQHKAIFNKIDGLDNETDALDDAIERDYHAGRLTKSQYRSLENSLDKVDDKLENMEDYLEDVLGLDD